MRIGRKFSECEKQQPSERAASGGMDWNARERTSECERLGSSSKPFDLQRSAQICALSAKGYVFWKYLQNICNFIFLIAFRIQDNRLALIIVWCTDKYEP